MESKQSVLGIGGSPRKGGNSDVLLQHVLKGVRLERMATEKVHLRDYRYEPCVGCERCRKDKNCTGLNDGMQLLYPKVIQCMGLVLVCPTHHYNVTAWMKAFIDRLYCFYDFGSDRPRGWSSRLANQGRKAVIVAICEQAEVKDMGFTLDAMRLPLSALGYEIIEELPVFGVFDRGAVKHKASFLDQATRLGQGLAKAVAAASS